MKKNTLKKTLILLALCSLVLNNCTMIEGKNTNVPDNQIADNIYNTDDTDYYKTKAATVSTPLPTEISSLPQIDLQDIASLADKQHEGLELTFDGKDTIETKIYRTENVISPYTGDSCLFYQAGFSFDNEYAGFVDGIQFGAYVDYYVVIKNHLIHTTRIDSIEINNTFEKTYNTNNAPDIFTDILAIHNDEIKNYTTFDFNEQCFNPETTYKIHVIESIPWNMDGPMPEDTHYELSIQDNN